jgi:endoglucanase
VQAVRAALAKGINMDHVFSPYRRPHPAWTAEDDAAASARIREEEFAQVARLGFTHIRLNLGRCFLQDYDPPCRLREEGFRLLDRALDLAARHRLAVVVDLHQVPVPPLDVDPAQRRGFADLWAAIAKRYRTRSQDLAYELLNEPRVEDPAAWRAIMSDLIAAIRSADPERPIVVTGGGWGGPEELLKVGVLDARNLVYTFHFYDPFVFTHQGATWSADAVKSLRGIRYPIRPAQMRELAGTGRPAWPFKDWMDGGGKAELEARMRPLFDWAKREGVFLYCGEFGVIRRDWTPPEDRVAWVRDVREILEANGAGWAMWAYRAGFDLVDRDGRADPGIVSALGLPAAP